MPDETTTPGAGEVREDDLDHEGDWCVGFACANMRPVPANGWWRDYGACRRSHAEDYYGADVVETPDDIAAAVPPTKPASAAPAAVGGGLSALEFVRMHRANYVIEPRGEHLIWTRVKCDGNGCRFYAEADRWFEAMDKHDAHVADLLAARERARDAAVEQVARVEAALATMDDDDSVVFEIRAALRGEQTRS